MSTTVKKTNSWIEYVKENRNKDEYKTLSYKELLKALKEPYAKTKNENKSVDKTEQKAEINAVVEQIENVKISDKKQKKRRI